MSYREMIYRIFGGLPHLTALYFRPVRDNSDAFILTLHLQQGWCTLKSFQDFLGTLPEHLGQPLSKDAVFMYLDLLMEQLTISDCSDPRLVAAVVNLNCVRKWGTLQQLREEITFGTLPQPDIVNVSDGIVCHIFSIRTVMSSLDWRFLKLLVRYCVVQNEILGISEFSRVERYNRRILTEFLRTVMTGTPNDVWKEIYIEKVCETLSFEDYGQLSEEGGRELMRRHTVARVLQVLNYDSKPEKQGVYVKCLIHYFEAIKEPLVSVSEIQRLVVKNVFLDQEEYVNESRLKQKLDKYRALFSVIDVDVLQPRSLRHLSRCAVRSSLCEKGTLPCVVSKLRLPSEVKDYILIVKLDGESPAVL